MILITVTRVMEQNKIGGVKVPYTFKLCLENNLVHPEGAPADVYFFLHTECTGPATSFPVVLKPNECKVVDLTTQLSDGVVLTAIPGDHHGTSKNRSVQYNQFSENCLPIIPQGAKRRRRRYSSHWIIKIQYDHNYHSYDWDPSTGPAQTPVTITDNQD